MLGAHNEEVTLAARAFTHGWDVFSPTRPFVYHYYFSGDSAEKRALHWDDRKDWVTLRDRSRERCNYLLCGELPANIEALTDIDRYGLGNARTIVEFETYCGIDFKKRTVSERALRSGFIPDLNRYRGGSIIPAVIDADQIITDTG